MWKLIDGYDNYEINEEGHIRNIKRGSIRKSQCKTLGYYVISLCNNGIEKQHKLHRLIATAFIENPNNSPFIDHIDHNKANNCLSNLRWATCSENTHNTSKEMKGFQKRVGFNTYQARIVHNNKTICLGTFDTPEEAHEAYVAKKNELAKEFSPYNIIKSE